MGRPFSEIGDPWCKWLKEDCMQIFREEIEKQNKEIERLREDFREILRLEHTNDEPVQSVINRVHDICGRNVLCEHGVSMNDYETCAECAKEDRAFIGLIRDSIKSQAVGEE